MILKLEIYSALCSTSEFSINGVNADTRDFGSSYDNDRENAEDYGCGDRRFERIPPTAEVLSKYSISVEEYHEVCERLESGLSFGRCGWCV